MLRIGCICLCLWSVQVAAQEPVVSLLVESETGAQARARIETALNAEVDLDFIEAPLSDVVEFIANTHDVPVIVDTRSLDDVGLGSDTPVTSRLKGISLRSALRLILRDLELTFMIQDEVLQITTPEECENQLVTRLYLVADLRTDAAVESNTNSISRFSMLEKLITTQIAPDSWDFVGGAGSITLMDDWGLVAVSQTQDLHDRIESLITVVRRARSMAGTTGG